MRIKPMKLRDKALIRAKRHGMSTEELSYIYGISPGRINTIVRLARIKKEWATQNHKKQ